MTRTQLQIYDSVLIALLFVLLVLAPVNRPAEPVEYSNEPYEMALSYNNQGDYASAFAAYTQAIQQSPYNRRVRNSYLRFIDRQLNYNNDLAGRLRNWLKTAS